MQNRVKYQKYWAFEKLLRLHLGDADYCLISEHYGDVSVPDGDSDPQAIEFYCEDPASGRWTLSRLSNVMRRMQPTWTVFRDVKANADRVYHPGEPH